MPDYHEINYAPFYIGQKVVGSGYAPGSKIKKGHPYIISSVRYLINPANGMGPYWYIGVEGMDNDWTTPKLYTAIEENNSMTFSEIKKIEILEKLLNN